MTLPPNLQADKPDAPHFCQRTADLYAAVDDMAEWARNNLEPIQHRVALVELSSEAGHA